MQVQTVVRRDRRCFHRLAQSERVRELETFANDVVTNAFFDGDSESRNAVFFRFSSVGAETFGGTRSTGVCV